MHLRITIAQRAARWIVGAVLAICPLAAYPLGLGTLEVKSALNEPLYAEVDFTSMAEHELKGVEVTLAPRADFDAVGAERLPLLSQIKFTVAQRADGRYYLQLRTEAPVDEPFLHMLLQIEWPGGRLVREYTALIDPPSYVAGRPPAIESPQTIPPRAAQISPFVETVPPPTPREGGPPPQIVAPPARLAVRPAEPPRSRPAPGPQPPRDVTIPAQTDRPAVAAEAGRTARADRQADWANFSEYTVRPGDTLWGIAERVRADTGLSLHRVMLAIFRNNPDAFFRENVNNLYAGKVLTIPERDQLEAIPAAQARREFRAHHDAWQEYKLKLAAGSRALRVADSAPAPAAPAPSPAAQKAEAEKRATADAPARREELLRIVRAPDAGKTAAGDRPAETESAKAAETRERAALAERVATLEESLESTRLETRELTEKVGQVRSQIKSEKRLIEIENQALAQQTAKPAPPESEPVKPQAKTEAPPARKPDAKPVAPAKPAQPAPRKPAPAPPPPPPEKGFVAVLFDTFTSLLDDFISLLNKLPSLLDDFMSLLNKLPSLVDDFPSLLNKLPSLLDDLRQNPFLPLVGGIVALAGGAIMMVYVRRRRRSIAEFEESILASDGIATDAGLATADTTGQAPTGDTSFLSDFTKSGMGQVHTDEVDPIAEAEVYLAYGRDETAEEILKEAVGRNPERHELKLKLLEIYHQRNDVNAFETLAEELYAAAGGRGGNLWATVEQMGKKLNPENPMFSGGAPQRRAAGIPDSVAMPPATHARSDAAFGGLAAAGAANVPMPETRAAEEKTPSIEFDFEPAPPAGPSLDFDLNSDAFVVDAAPEKSRSGESPPAPVDGLASLDFGVASDNLIDFEGVNSSVPTAGSPEADTAAADTSPAGSEDEIKWEIDAPAPAEPVAEAPDSGGATDGDGRWDETATKLDLAKAYIDMGDAEGARSILDEVLAEGNEQQKKQAAELAAQIA